MAGSKWTEDQDRKLKRFYEAFAGEVIPVGDIAQLVGHTEGAVRYRAHKLGLTERNRPRATGGADRERRCVVCGNVFEVRRPSDTQQSCSRSCAAKQRARTGFGGRRGRGRAKTGKRPDLGNTFFRSSWEANFARYLNELIRTKQIVEWEYEPTTFRFPVSRGNKSYTPDFKVWLTATDYEWHEVKGWMDDASRIKLSRFSLHFPAEAVKLRLVDREVYESLKAEWSSKLEGWE